MPKGLKGGAVIDITQLYPVNDPIIQQQEVFQERDVPTGRTRFVQDLNPAWDPNNPQAGVKKFINQRREPVYERRQVLVGTRPVVVGTRNDQYKGMLNGLVDLLGELAHFYSFRDPATALGFRVLKDDIIDSLPLYDGRPKGRISRKHQNAQEFAALSVLGKNPRNPHPQRDPQTRYRTEVLPLAQEAMKPSNPFKIVAKPPQYSAPPRTLEEAVFALQDRPEIGLSALI